MARHEVVIHENTSATHDVAPYTGSYISKETVALAEFAAAVGAKCGLPSIQVIAIIGGAFDAIAALEDIVNTLQDAEDNLEDLLGEE